MATYRPRPGELEAVQWNGGNLQELLDFTAGARNARPFLDPSNMLCWFDGKRVIPVALNDWVTKDKAENYALCSAGAFEARYDPA